MQYESPITSGFKVRAKVKVFVHTTDADADADADADGRAMTLAPRTYLSRLAKKAFFDFSAAGGIVFHEHISLNLKSAPVGTLKDFFLNCKNSKTIPPKFDCFVG